MAKATKKQQAFCNGKVGMQKDIPPVCMFEQFAKRLGLSPDQYEGNIELKAWAFENRNRYYVPTVLMTAWNFTTQWDVAERPTNLAPDVVAFADMTPQERTQAVTYELYES